MLSISPSLRLQASSFASPASTTCGKPSVSPAQDERMDSMDSMQVSPTLQPDREGGLSSSMSSPTKLQMESMVIVDLCDPVNDRVNLVTQEGSLYRVSISLVPTSSLLATVLDAFDSVLPLSLALSLRVDVLQACATQAHPSGESTTPPPQGQDLEWAAFIYVMSALIDRDQSSPAEASPVLPSGNAWESLLASNFHATYSQRKQLKGLQSSSTVPQSEAQQGPMQGARGQFQTEPTLCAAHISDIFDTLHLVYEQSKLSVLSVVHLRPLAMFLLGLAQQWNALHFMEHYKRDIGGLSPVILVRRCCSSVFVFLLNQFCACSRHHPRPHCKHLSPSLRRCLTSIIGCIASCEEYLQVRTHQP
jgi:hypothetical protein